MWTLPFWNRIGRININLYIYASYLLLFINYVLRFFSSFVLNSHHPYLFFNKDSNSFTFFGLNINATGDLVHKRSNGSNDIIEPGLMSTELCGTLSENMKFDIVNFSSDYEKLPRYKQIIKKSLFGISILNQTYILISLIKLHRLSFKWKFNITSIFFYLIESNKSIYKILVVKYSEFYCGLTTGHFHASIFCGNLLFEIS